MAKVELPEVHFGTADAKPIDWRKTPPERDPDDEELEVTPPDVVRMLGFDPRNVVQ